jgi:hypothetical protein
VTTPVTTVNLWRATRDEIAALCRTYGPLSTHVPADVDPVQLMFAFALNESIIEPAGLHFPPRFEPAYAPGGRYFAGQQEQAYALYGRDAACSFGPWQVMYFACKGFSPHELWDVEKCAQCFLAYMNRELLTQPPNTTGTAAIVEIGKAYNHGNWKDRFDDHVYTDRLLKHYAEAK